MTRDFSNFEDTDVTMAKMKESFNANLANGLGNLTSRIMKMAETNLESPVVCSGEISSDYTQKLNEFEIQKACEIVWHQIGELDKKIQSTEPFKLVKSDKEKGRQIITELVQSLWIVTLMLTSILPETSKKIQELIIANKAPATPLFVRKD